MEKVNIFTDFKIKNIHIKNRIVLPPMVRFSLLGDDGYVTEALIQWYGMIARSGVGLIIVEASAVEESGKLRENQIGIWNDSFIEGLTKVANEIHKYDVPCMIQIHHAGFKERISEVPEEELDRILRLFEEAFVRAKKCSFDGIEIHGAHTYLISQLNSKLWNKRKDKYGERLYFSKKLIENTKYLFDDNFILGYRMGGNEPELEDGIENAKILEGYGLDILHVSSGVPNPEYKRQVKINNFPKDFPLDWIIYMGTEIKKHINIPVIGVSKIKKESQASWLVENNLLDFVAVGKAMISQDKWMENARKDFSLRKK
ncbi:NADH:flavin oxidoreductase [Fusobacterium polymorphum]|uniref:NADH oxidase n=1 Tax=Fusobacterium nucleatum subsp. polymorphum TaxID=76857 RepID=A0A2C6AZF2_FUSNP|nr:NADH:flavin oxidoreductase [Fusobacterium polymorphum]PHI17270.1 NADH oxidase [Fusobacterium polymorphum]